jgi:hypothetical protein
MHDHDASAKTNDRATISDMRSHFGTPLVATAEVPCTPFLIASQ